MKGEKNSNPVHVTASQATTKSFQVKEYLLCPECEDRFRLSGEEWVLKNGYRGTSTKAFRRGWLNCCAICSLSPRVRPETALPG
jgi:hypothetical protein